MNTKVSSATKEDIQNKLEKLLREVIEGDSGRQAPEVCPYCKKGGVIKYSGDGPPKLVCSSCGAVIDEILFSPRIEIFYNAENMSSVNKHIFKRDVEERISKIRYLEFLVDILRKEGLKVYIEEFKRFYMDIVIKRERDPEVRRCLNFRLYYMAILDYFLYLKGYDRIIYVKYLPRRLDQSTKRKIRESIICLNRALGLKQYRDLSRNVYMYIISKNIDISENFVANAVYLLERLKIVTENTPLKIIAPVVCALRYWRGTRKRKVKKIEYTIKGLENLFDVASITIRRYVRKVFRKLLKVRKKKKLIFEESELESLRKIIEGGREYIDNALSLKNRYNSFKELYEAISLNLSKNSSM